MKLIIGFLFTTIIVRADMITVHNMSNSTVYVRPYHSFRYREEAEASTQTSKPVKIAPSSTAKVNRPGMKKNPTATRALFVSFSSDDLGQHIDQDMFLKLESVNVATPTFTNFYIYTRETSAGNLELHACNKISWAYVKPAKESLKSAPRDIEEGIKQASGDIKLAAQAIASAEKSRERYLKSAGPDATKVAHCRQGDIVSKEERDYLAKRKTKVRAALQRNAIKVGAGKEPVIALCASGGGVRSCVATLGSLIGLEKTGLLDSISYVAGLSGSTWCFAPMINFGFTPTKYKAELKNRLKRGLVSSSFNITQLAEQLIKKGVFDRRISLPDVYGGALSSLFLDLSYGKTPYDILLSNQQKQVSTGAFPFPIYTAIIAPSPYVWLEFNPYEIGSSELNAFIPSWALDRRFDAGSSTNSLPPEPLGYCMGIFGYALGVNVGEALDFAENKIKPAFVRDWIKKLVAGMELQDFRLLTAHVDNFTQGLNSSLADRKSLELIDAGIDFNLPIRPLCEPSRHVDIIIILDNSASEEVGGELAKAERYARHHNLSFPRIDYSLLADIESSPVAIFKEVGAPTVIYMPLVKNNQYPALDPSDCPDSFCDTFNFKYTPEQIDLLTGLTASVIENNKQLLLNEIQASLNRK